MAYGKRSYRKRSGSGMRHSSSYRKKAVSVPKVKRTTKRYTRSNSLAINRLSRKVNWLSQARYGSVQRNFQLSNQMIPLAGQPIITDIMDFSCARTHSDGARFGQFSSTTPPVLQNVGQWTPSTNLFHVDQNVDIPDTGKYLALHCHVTMKFTGVPSAIDTRIRVDLVSVKKVPQTQLGHPIFALPQALSQLTNLASPELNKLGGNPYLKVWATKWLYLSSSLNRGAGAAGAQNPGPAVTGNSGYLTFDIRPKGGRLRTQQITNPVTSLSTVAPTADGNWGPYNIGDQKAPLFLIISSSDPSVVGPAPNVVNVQMSRTVSFRDPIGKSSL